MTDLRSRFVALALLAGLLACNTGRPSAATGGPIPRARALMVEKQLRARGLSSPAVLAAMAKVPREAFVPPGLASRAYDDTPLPIAHEQTISQPYIVGLMSELAAVGRGERVLEVGTGSGYQAAVLAELGAEVYTIEIVEPLARSAAATLSRLGYGAVHTRIGDGYRGWPEAAPFDAIIVTAAPPHVPEPLRQQLKPGGRLVIPVGEGFQRLLLITRAHPGHSPAFSERAVLPVRFVPMVGEAGGKR